LRLRIQPLDTRAAPDVASDPGSRATSFPVDPRYFRTAAEFRRWLEAHQTGTTELLVGFHKTGLGAGGLTRKEAVDEALCVGWIDGVVRRVDERRYAVRFTPRKPTSIWSAVNIARVAELTAAGRMRPAGLAAFERRRESRSRVYSFEQENVEFTPAQRKTFRANPEAWAFFRSRPRSYRRTATWWVISAKREETRLRRLETLIDDSADGRRIKQLTRPGG
jgi:uncharacterized protein YdeI (YjbR/CyaY-like superfamily)